MAIGPSNPQDTPLRFPPHQDLLDRSNVLPRPFQPAQHPLYIPPAPPKRDWSTGWICPRCSTVHAPFVASCECRPAVDLGVRLS